MASAASEQVARRRAGVIALLLVIGLMWAGTLARAALDETYGLTLNQWLSQPIKGWVHADADKYLRIHQLMGQGTGYYEAAHQVLDVTEEGRPVQSSGAVRYRLPTLYWLWSLPLPAPALFVGGLLVFATAAVAAAWALARHLAGDVAAIVAATFVALYYSGLASSFRVTFSEPWAAALVLVSFAAFLLHLDRREDRGLLALSVGAALGAALVREIAVFALVAGLAAAVVGDVRDGRRRWLWWAGALAFFSAAYVVHSAALGGEVFSGRFSPGLWFSPGIARLLEVVGEGDWFLPFFGLLSLAAVLLAVLGILVMSHGASRVLLLVGVILPLVAMFVVGPVDTGPPGPANVLGYWGILVKPVLWTFVPVAVVGLHRRLRRADV